MMLSRLSCTVLLMHSATSLHIVPPLGFPLWNGTNSWVSPAYTWQYQYPLPLPAVAVPSYTQNFNGTAVDFYQSNIEKFQAQIYPNLGPTNLVGFNATSPGPTYRIERGTETIVRQVNNGNNPASTHLHGSWTRSPWDGWADNVIPIGQYKDYYYPNTQMARTMWYHDHADHFTAVDAYYGQNGFYIIHDAAEDELNLPRGNYDIPIVLMDKRYMNNGQLYSPANETLNFYGDIIHANGQPWPFLQVEPRKYRLRFLNACLSRAFKLWFNDDSTGIWLPLQVIASDGGLFAAPVQTTTLDISSGERYEVVFDFAKFAGKNITVGNNMQLTDIIDFDATNQVMRFVVGNKVSDTGNNDLPTSLGGGPMTLNKSDVDHVFNFQRDNGNWTINGIVYDDVKARVLARPPQGTVENWQLRYATGPGLHPVHVHLVDFNIVSRTGGSRGVLPYESAGRKDVVLLEPGEVVNVVARYGPWNGLYQFHCHNLIHEDNNMMAVMNVSALQALGYIDAADYAMPNDAAFGPRPNDPADYRPQYITATLMPSLAGSPAYREYSKLSSDLEKFWSTRAGGETIPLPTAMPTTLVTSAVSSAAPSGPVTGKPGQVTRTTPAARPSSTDGGGGLLGGLIGGINSTLGGILG